MPIFIPLLGLISIEKTMNKEFSFGTQVRKSPYFDATVRSGAKGFSVYNHPKYRNVPSWEIPIALKERRPETKIICDPSHITGNRDLLLEVSQKAMDLNFDGLMIESHPDPDNALSDAAQQVTPKRWSEMMDQLILHLLVERVVLIRSYGLTEQQLKTLVLWALDLIL